MSNTDDAEVKIVERSEVTPAEDDEEVVENPESSQDVEDEEEGAEEAPESDEEKPAGSEDEAGDGSTEADADKQEIDNAGSDTDDDENDGVTIKRVPGETPREYALRLDNTRLKAKLRKEQAGELDIGNAPGPAKKELPPEKKKILDKYKPEDINTLKEVFDVMAEDMGFVRQDQLGATSYQEKAGAVLDDFLEKHPEYQPQNDKDNVLWNRFKEEYGMYKQPQNPKDLKRILDKVHRDVFGIKPTAALNKNEATKRNIQVASHSGSSKQTPPQREGVKRNATAQGYRTDMLKGFSDDEIADLTAWI